MRSSGAWSKQCVVLMTAITEEGLARVIAQAVAQAYEAASRAAPQGNRRTGDSMHKYYTRIEKFSGDPASWKEWH